MFDSDTLRKKLADKLLGEPAEIPTSAFGRLGRTALTGARTGKMLLVKKLADSLSKAGEGGQIDVDDLVKIVASFGQLKGLIMKMGQILSYIDVALPEELTEALAVLQAQSQPMPVGRVRKIILQDLGPRAAGILSTLEDKPIAAASIGQVHRARLDNVEVAVKVQYPEIVSAIHSDFASSSTPIKIMSLVFPNARMSGFVNEMRDRLLEECDYEHEAGAQIRFGELFSGHPQIVIPTVYRDYCAKHVLTTEFIAGITFDEFLATGPSQKLRDEIGRALFEFYIGSLFEHRLYNCDPHPGNYLFLPDNRIAMLDYGCTRKFDDDFVERMAELTAAVHRDDPDELRQAYLDFGLVNPGQKYNFNIVRDMVRGFYGPMLEDKEQKINLADMSMKEMMNSKMELMKLALPSELLFLLRIRFGLMSVLSKLQAIANWRTLEAEYIKLA